MSQAILPTWWSEIGKVEGLEQRLQEYERMQAAIKDERDGLRAWSKSLPDDEEKEAHMAELLAAQKRLEANLQGVSRAKLADERVLLSLRFKQEGELLAKRREELDRDEKLYANKKKHMESAQWADELMYVGDAARKTDEGKKRLNEFCKDIPNLRQWRKDAGERRLVLADDTATNAHEFVALVDRCFVHGSKWIRTAVENPAPKKQKLGE